MEIREYRTYNEPEILRLYASVGWTAYTDHPEVLRQGFENSMLTLAAYKDDLWFQNPEIIRPIRHRDLPDIRRLRWRFSFSSFSWISVAG